MGERIGLRALKRRAAMRHVQDVALAQFDAHGWDAVTVEQIAAAAEVSPSSVYRYFGTKEGIVLYNPNDVALQVGGAEGDHSTVLEALHRTITDFIAEHGDDVVDRRRARYIMEVPSIQSALAGRMFADSSALATFIAERAGRDVTELEVQVAHGAIVGGLLAALRHWHDTDYRESVASMVDRTLTTLRNGLDVSLR